MERLITNILPEKQGTDVNWLNNEWTGFQDSLYNIIKHNIGFSSVLDNYSLNLISKVKTFTEKKTHQQFPYINFIPFDIIQKFKLKEENENMHL